MLFIGRRFFVGLLFLEIKLLVCQIDELFYVMDSAIVVFPTHGNGERETGSSIVLIDHFLGGVEYNCKHFSCV